MYQITAHCRAQVLVEVPYLLVQAVLFSVISYWMVQFEASPGEGPILGIGSDFHPLSPRPDEL